MDPGIKLDLDILQDNFVKDNMNTLCEVISQ